MLSLNFKNINNSTTVSNEINRLSLKTERLPRKDKVDFSHFLNLKKKSRSPDILKKKITKDVPSFQLNPLIKRNSFREEINNLKGNQKDKKEIYKPKSVINYRNKLYNEFKNNLNLFCSM